MAYMKLRTSGSTFRWAKDKRLFAISFTNTNTLLIHAKLFFISRLFAYQLGCAVEGDNWSEDNVPYSLNRA